MQLLKYHMYFFNGNSIIRWIPLRDRGVQFLNIGGKGVALCRCFDWHNKNPTKCLWHGSPTTTSSSFQPHIYMFVLSQIWLKHPPMWRKTKTSHFNSSLYVFFTIHVIHIIIWAGPWENLPYGLYSIFKNITEFRSILLKLSRNSKITFHKAIIQHASTCNPSANDIKLPPLQRYNAPASGCHHCNQNAIREVLLFGYIIFVYLSLWQFLPFIFNFPCLHGSLPSYYRNFQVPEMWRQSTA